MSVKKQLQMSTFCRMIRSGLCSAAQRLTPTGTLVHETARAALFATQSDQGRQLQSPLRRCR